MSTALKRQSALQRLKDEVVELEKSKVEIMVPLADVAKQTVKKKTDKTGKDYYNVQPYLYSLPQKNKEGGIYVDSSHLTQVYCSLVWIFLINPEMGFVYSNILFIKT